MSVLYIVLPLAILLAIAAVLAFSWAVRTGQMDDLKTPALRILHDDVSVRSRKETCNADDVSAPPSTQRSSVVPNAVQTEAPVSDRERLSATYAETPRARARQSQHDG
ncbi:MAG: cbb3-type cytochrome oxidase assembly protein CcoS [Polyangiaceae bacterium]